MNGASRWLEAAASSLIDDVPSAASVARSRPELTKLRFLMHFSLTAHRCGEETTYRVAFQICYASNLRHVLRAFDPLTLVARTGSYASISKAERRGCVALLLRGGGLCQVIRAEVGWLGIG